MLFKFSKLRRSLATAHERGRRKERKHNKRILKDLYKDWSLHQKKNRILQKNAVWDLERNVDQINKDHKSELERIDSKFKRKEKELDNAIQNNKNKDIEIHDLSERLTTFTNELTLKINKIIKNQEDRLANTAIGHKDIKDIKAMQERLSNIVQVVKKSNK